MAEQEKEKKVNIFKRIGRTIRDTRGEMKKVVWPTKKQALNNTMIVLVFMAIMAVIIGLFDFGLGTLIRTVLLGGRA
jgi:preprotein translocase subunit SecE